MQLSFSILQLVHSMLYSVLIFSFNLHLSMNHVLWRKEKALCRKSAKANFQTWELLDLNLRCTENCASVGFG
uniref:Uncharacterized protein n=1 Tax=Arundo donax TaxID=35708 RepID=A0A0A9BUY9_ARUDO